MAYAKLSQKSAEDKARKLNEGGRFKNTVFVAEPAANYKWFVKPYPKRKDSK